MADGSAPSPASGRQVAPEDVWEAVKEDYVDGLSAAQCCRRHGVGRSALYKRAAAQKWRRVDLPWTPPALLDAEDEGVALAARVDGDIDRIEFHELAFVAQARMMRAVLRGDAVAALRWRRVRLIMDAEADEMAHELARDEHLLREAEDPAEDPDGEDWVPVGRMTARDLGEDPSDDDEPQPDVVFSVPRGSEAAAAAIIEGRARAAAGPPPDDAPSAVDEADASDASDASDGVFSFTGDPGRGFVDRETPPDPDP
jgi:hypothetical protein